MTIIPFFVYFSNCLETFCLPVKVSSNSRNLIHACLNHASLATNSKMKICEFLTILSFISQRAAASAKFDAHPWRDLAWKHFYPKAQYPKCEFSQDCVNFCMTLEASDVDQPSYQLIYRGYCGSRRHRYRCGCRIFVRISL